MAFVMYEYYCLTKGNRRRSGFKGGWDLKKGLKMKAAHE
jgi:hypothetical protein